jgi:pyridoxamine 5'-phosphate oxidase
LNPLTTGDFTESQEPFALFNAWMTEAEASEPNDPNAMALATVDETGLPNVRMVLLKGFDENGFVFYTNTESNKGRELLGQKKAAIVLHWKSLRRQVRARGPVTVVSDAEADAYFQSRARDSRIGAWASQQSRPLESRFALEKAVAVNTAKYAIGRVRPTGRVSASRRCPSSSGRTSRSGSTIGSSSPARATAGGRCGCIPDTRSVP